MSLTKIANFVQQVMSGSDNKTPAIGRYLAVFLFINFLFALPTIIVVAMVMKNAEWDVWEKMLAALTLYVPAICTSAAVLIWGTHKTEPGG